MNFIITYLVAYGLPRRGYGYLGILVLRLGFKIVRLLVDVLGLGLIWRCLSRLGCCDRVIGGNLID